MLQAFLKNKLQRYLKKEPEDIEDLVTSLVFGSCEYANDGKAILPFVLNARNQKREKLSDILGYSYEEIGKVKYTFWKRQSFGEPELLLEFEVHGKKYWIAIEAKVLSDKSGGAKYELEQLDFKSDDFPENKLDDTISNISSFIGKRIHNIDELNKLLTDKSFTHELESKLQDILQNNDIKAIKEQYQSENSEYIIKYYNRKLVENIKCIECNNIVPPVYDQLAKYWIGLSQRAMAMEEKPELKALIYVTCDSSYPKRAFEETVEEYTKKSCRSDIHLYWRPWLFFPTDLYDAYGDNAPKIITDEVLSKNCHPRMPLSGIQSFQSVKIWIPA